MHGVHVLAHVIAVQLKVEQEASIVAQCHAQKVTQMLALVQVRVFGQNLSFGRTLVTKYYDVQKN